LFFFITGVEVDILGDGSLDFPDEILAKLDVVIAAVHGQYNFTKEAMTKRICKALENPYVDVFAHPTGRKLLAREGYSVELEEVFECANREGVAIEINGQPSRLDLDWRYIKSAKDKGTKFSINPDAHSAQSMEYYKLGVSIARKGWLTKGDVINTRSLDDFTKNLRRAKLVCDESNSNFCGWDN